MSGRRVREASRSSGVPLATVIGWARGWEHPPPAPIAPPEVIEQVIDQIRSDKKAEIVAAAWDLAKAGFARSQAALGEASAKDAATVAGIAIDKAQLLSGDATDRVDIRAILATLPAPVRAAVIALAQEPDPAD